MRVLLVTSPNEKCGIREHSDMLMDAVLAARPTAIIDQYRKAPDMITPGPYDVIHIDHHAALHAAWTPAVTDDLRSRGFKVVLTQHDTFETLDIMLERNFYDFHDHVDALVVHEPVEGLTDQGYDNVYYWRQPVPELPLDVPPDPVGYLKPLNNPPVVGTVGFDFPWKGFKKLEEAAAEAGWKTRIFRSSERWLSRDELLGELRKCDATAFLYDTGNSGTSAAIRLGIAARRPVIATQCRQFRDLRCFEEDAPVLLWLWTVHPATSLALLAEKDELRQRVTDTILNLASLDSWSNAGRRYAALYRKIAGRA